MCWFYSWFIGGDFNYLLLSYFLGVFMQFFVFLFWRYLCNFLSYFFGGSHVIVLSSLFWGYLCNFLIFSLFGGIYVIFSSDFFGDICLSILLVSFALFLYFVIFYSIVKKIEDLFYYILMGYGLVCFWNSYITC